MTRRLRILVVHNVENLRSARRSTMDHVLCFERYAPDHDYIYHRIQLPVTEALRSTEWDAVIFESTALGVVTIRPRERFFQLREEWAFLRNSKAVKFAFPQDDASHSALYDGWLNWMRVDVVFCVRPEKIDKLYPRTKQIAEFRSTVAGFIDDQSVDALRRLARPWRERSIHLGQRVTRYPAWGGRFAQRKSDIVLRLAEECGRRALPVDVSTHPGEVLHGDAWYGFLGDCKFVAGAEGGHGLWDPYGTIQDEVNDYVARHPGATFDEIEAACFAGLDGVETFPGFAPRVLEAALMGCGQVLLEGRYRDFIKPGVHYISVRDDYSNLDDVFALMENDERVAGMVARCMRDLVDSPTFRYSKLVGDVIALIEARTQAKAAPSFDPAALYARHVAEMRDALTVIGVEREKLYEPYLTEWVNREMSGQMRDEDEAARHAITLPGAPAETPPPAAPLVQEAALAHICTVLQTLPRAPGVLPRVADAILAQGGDLTAQERVSEAAQILKAQKLNGEELASAAWAALPGGESVEATQASHMRRAIAHLFRIALPEGDALENRRIVMQGAGLDVDDPRAVLQLAGQDADACLDIATRLGWSDDAIALLRAAGLEQNGPLNRGDRQIAAALLDVAGFDARDLRQLAGLSGRDPMECASIAESFGWSPDVAALLRAARLDRDGPIVRRDRQIAAALLEVAGFDARDLRQLAAISGSDPAECASIAEIFGWSADIAALLRAAGLEKNGPLSRGDRRIAAALLELAGFPVSDMKLLVRIAGRDPADCADIADALGWSPDVAGVLHAAGLERDGALTRGDRGVAAALLEVAGFQPTDLAALAALAGVDASHCADVAQRLGWSADLLAMLAAARLDHDGPILRGDPRIAAAFLELAGFDPHDLAGLGAVTGVDPADFAQVARRLHWPDEHVAFLGESQKTTLRRAAFALLARTVRKRVGV